MMAASGNYRSRIGRNAAKNGCNSFARAAVHNEALKQFSQRRGRIARQQCAQMCLWSRRWLKRVVSWNAHIRWERNNARLHTAGGLHGASTFGREKCFK